MYSVADAEIIVVDQDDEHVYQPGLLFVPFGLADPARLAGRDLPGISATMPRRGKKHLPANTGSAQGGPP